MCQIMNRDSVEACQTSSYSPDWIIAYDSDGVCITCVIRTVLLYPDSSLLNAIVSRLRTAALAQTLLPTLLVHLNSPTRISKVEFW